MVIPPELLREIIAFLPQAQLVSCALVSPSMKEFSQEILYRKVVLQRDPTQLIAFCSALEGDSRLPSLVKVLKITLEMTLKEDAAEVTWSAKGQDALVSILTLCSPTLNKLYIRGSPTAKESKDLEFSFLSLAPQTQSTIANLVSIAPNLRVLSLASLLVPPDILARWLAVKHTELRWIYAHPSNVPVASNSTLDQTGANPSFKFLASLRLHFLDDMVQHALLNVIGEKSFGRINQIRNLELQGHFRREVVTSLLSSTKRTLRKLHCVDVDWELPGMLH